MKNRVLIVVQQLNRIGSIELSAVKLSKLLADYYEVCLISMEEIKKIDPVYRLDPNVSLFSMNIEPQFLHIQDYLEKIKLDKKGAGESIKYLSFIFSYWNKNRDRYRSFLTHLTSPNDILIATSLDSYLIMPKERYFINQCYLNSGEYFDRLHKTIRRLSNQPDFSIFSSAATLKLAVKKKKALLQKSNYIYIPSRFEHQENYRYQHNRILFIGNLIERKKPLKALKIAESLMKRGIDFKLTMCGNGSLLPKVEEFIKTHQLENYVELKTDSVDILKMINQSDLLLSTSAHDGSPLTAIECMSQSVPVFAYALEDEGKEIVSSGVSGYTFNNESECVENLAVLLTNQEKLMNLKKSTYKYFTTFFSDSEIVKKWRVILDTMFQLTSL